MACRLELDIQVVASPSLGSVTRVKTQEMVLERGFETGKMLQQNCQGGMQEAIMAINPSKVVWESLI
jgi:hypothetical protein